MPDFQKAKIYKITNDFNNDVYIGSTCDELTKRFSLHKSEHNHHNCKHRPLYKLMNEIGFNRFRIQLLENYPCSDKYEMRQKEGEYIRKFGTLNIHIAVGIINQKENPKEYNKEYNKLRYETKQKIPVVCECCCIITSMCKKRHEKTKKHIQLMEEKLKQNNSE
jgi:hypothetical protein